MLDKGFGESTQLVALSLREVISFTFAEKCQQIDWYVGIVIVVGTRLLVGKPTEPFVTP